MAENEFASLEFGLKRLIICDKRRRERERERETDRQRERAVAAEFPSFASRDLV